ncbi:MAG TPA: glycosyltransferase family 39 protein [Aggregatilineales bacterium]|nr:glycosyltransferase family 39 protein [Aggregatilineales bacterium]
MNHIRRHPFHAALPLLMVGWLIFHLLSLVQYPPPSCDEAYYSNGAYTLLTTGRFGLSFYDDLAGADTTFVVYGRLLLLTQALFHLLIPSPLWAARLWALTGGLLLIGASYALGKQLFGQHVGGWSALLVAANWAVFYGSHSARPDVWLIASAMLALYLVFRLADHPTAGWAVVTGFAVTLLQDVHLNGMHLIAACGLIALITLGIEQRRWKLVILYALGSAAGVLYFLVVHLFPDPQLAITQYQTLTLGEDREFWLHPLGFHLRNLGKFLWDNYVREYNGLAAVLSAFYALGVAVLIRRNPSRREARLLGLFIIASLVSFSLVNVHKPAYYAVLWHPPLTLLGAAGAKLLLTDSRLTGFWQRLPAALHNRSVDVLLAGLFVALTAGNLYLAVKYRSVDYAGYARRLRAAIPAGERVLADELWWYALYDRDMVASIKLYASQYARHEATVNPKAFSDDMRIISPDYIVLGEVLGCRDVADETYRLLENYVSTHCSPVGKVEGAWFVESVIYFCEDDAT